MYKEGGGLFRSPFFFDYMIKLKKTTDNQTISFIPRFYIDGATYNVKITSEGEDKVVHDQDVTSFTSEKYFYQYNSTFSFRLDATYLLEISHDNSIIFSDRILVTNQSGDYSISDQVYTYKSTPENSTENQFKLYS